MPAPLPAGVSGTYGCGLAASLDVRAARAELLFQRGQHEAAHRITSAVVDAGRDPLPLPLLPVHVACSLALGRKSELFIRGHALVQHAPDSACE